MNPTKNISKFIDELKKLNLPLGEYVIVSSGSMAIRGIRECSDLDLLITKKLFDELSEKYTTVVTPTLSKISIGDIECLYIQHRADDLFPTEKQISEAEMIQGFPFQKLETCLYFKENSSREKDRVDVELIKEYLANK